MISLLFSHADTAGSMSAPELTSLHSFLSMTPLTIFFLKSKAPVIVLALLFFFERREELAITVCVCMCIAQLRRSAFFTVQLSHPYMTIGKTTAFTRRTLVGKVMSLLLNILSRLVITFLPRSKRLLISWLQSPSAVILEYVYIYI